MLGVSLCTSKRTSFLEKVVVRWVRVTPVSRRQSYATGERLRQEVFNGDIGRILRLNQADRELTVRFDEREVVYDYDELDELTPAYAVTVHKSQGSEYPCVVMVLHTQHYALLQRNLLYTALTRGRKLVVLIGSKRAVAIAVKRAESHSRVTTLSERLICSATGYTSLPATGDRKLAAEERADYRP